MEVRAKKQLLFAELNHNVVFIAGPPRCAIIWLSLRSKSLSAPKTSALRPISTSSRINKLVGARIPWLVRVHLSHVCDLLAIGTIDFAEQKHSSAGNRYCFHLRATQCIYYRRIKLRPFVEAWTIALVKFYRWIYRLYRIRFQWVAHIRRIFVTDNVLTRCKWEHFKLVTYTLMLRTSFEDCG